MRRATLFEETHTTLQIGFRELRNTGITWYAIEGMDVFRLHALAGHREVGTTMKYINKAALERDGFGDVFPSLDCLL